MTLAEIEFAEVEVPSVLAIQVPGQCRPDPTSISAAIKTVFPTLGGVLGRNRLIPAGPPRVIYISHNPQSVSFILAMPIAPPVAPIDDPAVQLATLPPTKAYRFTHHGPYCEMDSTYNQITAFMKAKAGCNPRRIGRATRRCGKNT